VISEKYIKRAEETNIYKKLGIPPPVYAHYDIMVTKVYKGNISSTEDTYATFFKRTIQTNNHGAMCGRSFTKGKTYLITGRFINNELQVNLCDWVQEANELTKLQKIGLKHGYDCKCQVNTCMNGYCENQSACKWQLDYDQPIDECTQKHRICRTGKVGKCGWSNGLFYESCTNKIIVDIFQYKL